MAERARTGVAYVLRMFPQTSETFIQNEILEVERQGVDVRIFSYRRPRADVRHAAVAQIRAPVTYLPDPLDDHLREVLAPHGRLLRRQPSRYLRTAAYVLHHTLRERNPDTWRRFLQAGYIAERLLDSDVGHLHAHFAHGATRVAMLASMLSGLPYSFTAHARDVYSDDVDFRLLRHKIDAARFAVTVSRYNNDFITDRLGEVDGALRTLYNGVDLEKFRPGPAAAREPGLVLGVGRLIEKKGFCHLVEACRILRASGRELRCEIVGGGELRERLERQIADARLEGVVTLAGSRSQEELLDHYRRAELVVMPAVVGSDGNRDALPTVLLEALACGVPVIASRLTGIPEIVDDGENGYLVEPGDAPALSAAMERLLEDPSLRARFGAAARAKAERCFDLRRNAAVLRGLFAESVGLRATRDEDAARVPVL
jgi:colanic acid/amylovoran biosynthesis glycosyltransferase